MPNDNLKKYYSYLKSNGADVAPTYDSFVSTLSNEANAKKYYSYLQSNGFDTPPSYDQFANTLGIKKKDPTASGSGTSSSGRLSNTTTKPTASSSSKGEIFTGYPGKEEKPYQFKDGKWYEEAPVKVYGQKAQYVQIQDPNRIGNLNKQFKKDASLSQEYELFNNYDDEKADNQYRIKDGQWQRMTPGSKWHTIQNEGSINALNNRYGKSVSTRVVTTTTMKPAKFDDINSDFVAKTEENAIKYLTEKYGKYGFEFSEEGAFLIDQIRVKTKDGSKEKVFEFDEKNPEQARELRAFLEVNATKSYSENFDKALNSLNKFEGKDQMSGPKMGTGQYGYQQQSAIIRGKNLLSNEFQSEFKKLPFEEQKEIIQEQIIGTGLPTNDVQSFYKSAAYQDYKKKKIGGDQQSKSKQDQIYDDYQYALATKDPAKIKEAKAKIDAYYTDDIIQDNVKTYNMKLNDFEQSQKNILQDRKSYDEEVSRFNELAQSGKMTQEQYDAQKKILDDKAESLETRAQNFVMQKKEIQASQNKLNLVAGKYVAAKEKEGNLGGFLVNKVLTGVSMAFVEPFAALEASAEKRYDQLSPEEKAYYKSIKYNGKNLTKDQIENLLDNQAMLKAKNEAKESIIKTLGAEGTTIEYMKSGDRGFITQAIGGVLESLPAMATGIAGKAAGFTGLALQAYSGIEEEMLSDPDFQYTSAGDRAIIAIPYAAGMGVLENVGLQNLVKGDSFLGKVMMDVAIKSAKKVGANATKEALERVAAKEVESLLAKGLIRVTQAGVAEFETGFTQALVLDQGLKQAYNWIQQSGMTEEQRKKLTQGEYFDTADTLKELGSKTFEDGVAEMIGGFTMGSVGTLLQAVTTGNISLYNEDDVKFLKDVAVDSNFKKLYVASMKTQMLDGKITKSKAQQNLDNLNEIEAAFDMMPDGLSTADMNTSLSLITERAQLTREKAGKDPNLVAPLEARIKAINEELTKIGENAVQEQATSEVSVQPGTKGGREVEERKPETGLKETTQKGKEEVDQYIADMGAEARIGNTINPVMEKMANAEYINDNDIDNAIEAIFNEVESLDKSDYSVETKAALSEKLLNIAEKLDNYEFRTKTETVATTKAGAATTTRRTSEAVQKIRAEKYFNGVQATVNGQEVTLTDNNGRVEAKMPNGEVVVLDTPTMEIAEDGFEFDDSDALVAVTVTDRLGNTARLTGDQALDFAIRDRENKLGVVEQAEFDTVYQEVEKKYIKENQTPQAVAEEEAVVEEQQPVVEEEAVVEEEKQPTAEPSEANRFTERNAKVMAVKFPSKKGIIKAALNVIKALPGVKIYLHEDSDQYTQELASRTGETKQSIASEKSAGSYINGEIHLDMSKADLVTLLHEAFHHAFLTLGVKNGMFIDLAKGLRPLIRDKARLAELDEFIQSYTEETDQETLELRAEEFAAQLGGILASNREELTTTRLTQFKALINRIAKKIGLGMVFSAAANSKEAADFINAITRGLTTGENLMTMEPYTGGSAVQVKPNAKMKPKYLRLTKYDVDFTTELPTKTLKEVVEKYEGRVFVIQSDATGVGYDSNGDPIYGGIGYIAIKDNVDGKIGFASVDMKTARTTISKMINRYGPNEKVAVLVMAQNPSSTVGNYYGGKYFGRGLIELQKQSKTNYKAIAQSFIDFIESKRSVVDALNKNKTHQKLIDLIKNPGKYDEVGFAQEFVKDTTFDVRREILKTLLPEKSDIRTNKSTPYIKQSLKDLGFNRMDFLNEYGDNTLFTEEMYASDEGGLLAAGFEMTLPSQDNISEFVSGIENKGIKHHLFNGKLPYSDESFLLDGLYPMNENFSQFAKPQMVFNEEKLGAEKVQELVKKRYPEDKSYEDKFTNASSKNFVSRNNRTYTHLTSANKIKFKEELLATNPEYFKEQTPDVATDVARGMGFTPERGRKQEELLEKARTEGFSKRKKQLVYHGGDVINESDLIEGDPLYVTQDKKQAELYAREHGGSVAKFDIDETKLADEELAYELIDKLGLKAGEGWVPKELSLYELIDPMFEETAMSQSDINKLFEEITKRGYDGIKFTDANLKTLKQDIENYVIINPKKTLFSKRKKQLTTDKDAIPGYDAALEALGETEAQREAWKKENKVNQKQNRNPIVEQAAKDYFNEEINQEEYLDTVAKNQPIKLFKNVPRLPSLKEIVNSLKDNQVATGIIGLTKNLVDGARVACRLDIPAYEWFDTWVVSIHDGVKEGKSIAYGQTAVLKNVDFKTFPGTAMRIATGSQKTTIARMFGDWVNEDPKSVHARAEELMNDPAWTQVGMNPFRYSWFYDKSDGMPVVSADEVIQVGALVLAKNVKKVSPNDPMFETKSAKGGKIKFQKKAPNGKPSNLSDKQWEQVRTPAFKKWFGDWENDPENASKVVDENGEPLIIYHGSSGGFDEFKEEYLGDVTETEISQMGFFFTNNENVAKTFQFVSQEPNMADLEKIVLSMSYDEMVEFNEAVMKTSHFRKGGKIEDEYDEPYEDFLRDIENDSQVGNLLDSKGFIGKAVNFLKSKGIEFTPYVGGEMYKVFLNIKNPFEINAGGGLLDNSQSISYDQNKYDGVIVRNTLDSIPMSEKDGGIESDVFITNNPNAIKSATENVGTFSAETPKIKFQKAPKILGVKPTVVIVNDEQKALVDQIKLEVRAQREQKKAYKQVLADISARVTALKSKGNISVKQFDAIMKNLKRLNFDNETKVQAFIDYVSRALANADYVEKVARAQSLNKRIKASLKGTANPFAVLAKMFTTLDSRWVQNIDDHIAVAQIILDGVKPSTARRGVLTLKEEPDLQVIAEYIDTEQTLQTKMLLDNLKARYERITGKPAAKLDAKTMLTELQSLNPTVDQTDKIKEQIDEKLAEYADMLTDEDPQVIVDAINIDTDIMDWKDAVKVLDSLDTYFTNGSLAGIEALMGTYKGLENAKKFKYKSSPISVLGIKPLGRTRFKKLVGFPSIMERKFRSQEKGLSYLKVSGINDIITGANRADYEASKKQLEYVRKFGKVKGFYSNENIYERGVIADLIRTNPGIDQDSEFERLVNILMNSKDMLLESQDKTKVDMGKLYDKVFKKLGLYDADADIESVKAKANKANLEAVNFVVDMFAEKYDLLSDTAMSIYNTILGQDINYTPKTYLLSKMSEDDKFDMNDSGLSMYTNNFAMNEAGVLMPITRPDDLKDRYVDLNFDNNMFRSYRLALTDAYTAKSIRQLNSFYNSKENENIIGSEKDYNIIRGQLSTYIKSIKGKNFVTKNEDRWASKFGDILSTLGSVRALAGIVQFAQQFASGMGSTIIQAGEYIRPSDFTKQAFSFMNRSGQPIANVGENDILLSLTNLDKSIERATVGKNMAEMSIEWYAKMNGKVFQVLVSNPDAAARRLAWMAYYRKYAVKNKLGPIDFNAEPNADAAAYAQSMLDRSMDATDARIRGEVYTSTNDAEKLLTRMFIPFSSFGMNQRTKMWGDIEKVFTGNANFDTARSLTSIVAEQAIYNTIRYYASKYILIGVMHFLGYDDEEQEELLNELKKNIESSAWAKSIVDTVSPLALVDDYVLKIANDLMDWANIAEPDKKKVDEFIKEENDKRKVKNLDPLTPDQEMRKREEFIVANSMRFYISDEFSFGTMGIQAEKFSEMYEMQKALRTGSYTDERGNEKYFDDEAKEKLASILMIKGIAMGTPVREVDQFANKSFKLLKKGHTMSQKKNDMITEVKKKFGKLDPVLEKLAEKKNKLTSIEAEIKWINDNKGLKGSKEKEEYAKLLDFISQPSKKMLKMIQDGKTAQYIFDQELKK